MTWSSKIASMLKKYGSATKFAAKTVLGMVPGGAAITPLIEAAVDATKDVAQDDWEATLERTLALQGERGAEVERALGVLDGDLKHLVAQVAGLEALPDAAERIIAIAKANDERCKSGFERLDLAVASFSRLEEQNRALLDGQRHAAGLIAEVHAVVTKNGHAAGDKGGIVPVTDPCDLRVAVAGEAHFRKLSEALARAGEGAVIRLGAGTYVESITLTRPVSIVGEGQDKVVLHSVGGSVLRIEGVQVSLRGVTIHGVALAKPKEGESQELGSLSIGAGAHASLTDCSLRTDGGTSICVTGDRSALVMQACKTEDAIGLSISGSARVQLNSCTLRSSSAVLWLSDSARVVAQDSSMISGMARCSDAATLEVTRCVLQIEGLSGLMLFDESRLTAKQCRFESKVMICERSRANLVQTSVGAITASDEAILELDGSEIQTTEYGIWASGKARVRASGGKIVAESALSALEHAELRVEGVSCRSTEGKRSANTGVSISDEAKLRLERSAFERFHYGARICDATEARILECRFAGTEDSHRSGINLDGRSKLIMEKCEISGFASAGVDVSDAAECTIRRTRIHGSDVAVTSTSSTKATVSECDLRGNRRAALRTDDGARIRDLDNRV